MIPALFSGFAHATRESTCSNAEGTLRRIEQDVRGLPNPIEYLFLGKRIPLAEVTETLTPHGADLKRIQGIYWQNYQIKIVAKNQGWLTYDAVQNDGYREYSDTVICKFVEGRDD